MSSPPSITFDQLALSSAVIKALKKVGYETPSPIQAEVIPFIMRGQDVIGQAQTGTGKTAAFALPLLSRISLKIAMPQVLVLTPTRELAIQVAEAFQRYASFMKGFHVLPIYGGQDYGVQLRQLKRGAHVVVGTPGRVMDHMRRRTLNLEALTCLVLDEADEMLRMGFIEDVEWILEQTPEQRQITLFSATIPVPIRKISKTYLHKPEQITIETKSITADTIKQRYLQVNGKQKLEALTTILESLDFDAMIVFVRTRIVTLELAERLAARGYLCAALNGDISQKIREQTVNRLKNGKLDILIATDVAARGLDVERISHVINYDIPNDPESYTHRIGRTGRAGRKGTSLLFVTQREQRLLRTIEKVTGKKVERYQLPTVGVINQDRIERFKQNISEHINRSDHAVFRNILKKYAAETGHAELDIATALAAIAQGDKPFLLKKPNKPERKKTSATDSKIGKSAAPSRPAEHMERFRLEVGSKHGAKESNVVGAIANEAGVDSCYIQNITMFEQYTTLDLPLGMPHQLFRQLKNVRIAGRKMNITRLEAYEQERRKTEKKKRKSAFRKKKSKKSTARTRC